MRLSNLFRQKQLFVRAENNDYKLGLFVCFALVFFKINLKKGNNNTLNAFIIN